MTGEQKPIQVGDVFGVRPSQHRLIEHRPTYTFEGAEGSLYVFEALARPNTRAGLTKTGEKARDIITRTLPVSDHLTRVAFVDKVRESKSVSGRHIYHIGIFVAE